MKLINHFTEIKREKELKQYKLLSSNSSAIGHDLFPFSETVKLVTVRVQVNAKSDQMKAGLT